MNKPPELSEKDIEEIESLLSFKKQLKEQIKKQEQERGNKNDKT